MKPLQISRKIPTDKFILIGSFICFIYFLSLVMLSHYKVQITILGVFIELLTIPLILLLIFLTFISIKNSIQTQFNIKSSYYISFLLLLITIIILTLDTICE